MKAVFFGTPQFAADIVEALVSKGISIIGVVTTPDVCVGRKQVLTQSSVADWADSNSIKVLKPTTLKDTDFHTQIISWAADVWIVVAYGKILPQLFLDFMPHKVINIHPSLLPQYRGPSPMQASLLNGDKVTGTTVMVMDFKMDHGPILGQTHVDLPDDMIYPELAEMMIGLSTDLVVKVVPLYITGELKPQPQDHEVATYVSMISKSDGEIDWTESALTIYNQYRAYASWPGVFGFSNNKKIDLIIKEYDRVTELKEGEWRIRESLMYVGTSHGQIIVESLKEAGKSWWSPQQAQQSWGSTGFFRVKE